jgi:uncharacterized protein YbjQ (UPF0145 family)
MQFWIIFSFGLPFFILGTCWSVGLWIEHRHLKSLAIRESRLAHIIVTDLGRIPGANTVDEATLVAGEVVLAADRYNSFLAVLKQFVGGEMRSLHTLATRARREAVVRMLEEAQLLGATEVHNVRLDTANIVNRSRVKKNIAAEIVATGTAISRRQAKAAS